MPDTSLAGVHSPSLPETVPTKNQQQQQQVPSSNPSKGPVSPATANNNNNGNNHTTSSISQPSSPNNNSHTSPTADAPDHKPPLKSKVKGKDPSTRPSSSSNETSKERPTTAALHLEQYIHRDLLHASALHSQHSYSHELIRCTRREIEYYHQLRRERGRNPGAVFGYGYAGYGNGTTDGNARVLYPCQRKRPGGRKARELRLTRAQLQDQADQVEMLVPVRLDIDFNQIKLRDTFTYNMHERTVPLDLFVEQLVEDFHLPLNPALLHMVTNSVRDQVTDYHPHVFLADEPLDPVLPYTAYKNDDMRVLIKLNITIGQHTLVDQFEWDINNPLNSPEDFAMLLTRELSLSGEFTTAIAHSIREQCQLFTKALYVTNHPFDGRPIEDEDVRSAMLQSPMPSVFRPYILAKEFTPLLYELSENELDRAEKSQSREQRRLKRRVNRRGGPTIPDLKDMPKTHRTQIVSSVLPGAVQKVTDLEKSMQVKQVKDGDSDDEESESEPEDLPPEKTIPGFNNMTRRQRVAAINAQKVNSQARSQTPEVHTQQHHVRSERGERYAERLRHETPQQTPVHHPPPVIHNTLPRRAGVPLHQDSALFKIKISAPKLQKWVEEQRRQDDAAKLKEQQQEAMQKKQQELQQQASMLPPKPPAQKAPQTSSPPVASSPLPVHPPPPRSAEDIPVSPLTPFPPIHTNTPQQPPEWLSTALSKLRETYTSDRFEATMRRVAYDAETGQSIQQSNLPNHSGSVKWKWIPRIRCHDCPGKLYTPGPEQTVDSFLVHVKNRGHRYVLVAVEGCKIWANRYV